MYQAPRELNPGLLATNPGTYAAPPKAGVHIMNVIL